MSTPGERNQRAKIRIDPSNLRHLLGLPEGVYIAAVVSEYDPAGIVLVVEGEALEPQPQDTCLPLFEGSFTRQTRLIDGEVWTRWEWSR